MEHRCCERRPQAVAVQLSGHRVAKQIAKIRNVSLDGMFVETEQGILSTGLLVNVRLPVADDVCCLKALVVHSGVTGAGLLLCALGNEERRLLARMLAKS